VKFLRALFRRKPKRHFPTDWSGHQRICNCGHTSAWDSDLRHHFDQVGRVG